MRSQLVLISSADKIDPEDSNTDFTVQLVHPIDGVVRTDVRQLLIGKVLLFDDAQLIYGIGDRVSFNGDIFECIQAIESQGYGPFGGNVGTIWKAVTQPAYVGIQSRQLGTRIYSGSDIAMYDVIPMSIQPFTYERWASKVNESVYEKPVLLYQIDLRFVNPDGSTADFGGADVTLVLEVITEN